MDEAVSDELPQIAVQEKYRDKRPYTQNLLCERRRCQLEQKQQKIRADIPEDQPARKTAEVGEIEDSCSSWHTDCFILSENEARAPFYRSGKGATAGLRCPCGSTARTPKMTLSLEMGSVIEYSPVLLWSFTGVKRCQSGAANSRQTIS